MQIKIEIKMRPSLSLSLVSLRLRSLWLRLRRYWAVNHSLSQMQAAKRNVGVGAGRSSGRKHLLQLVMVAIIMYFCFELPKFPSNHFKFQQRQQSKKSGRQKRQRNGKGASLSLKLELEQAACHQRTILFTLI